MRLEIPWLSSYTYTWTLCVIFFEVSVVGPVVRGAAVIYEASIDRRGAIWHAVMFNFQVLPADILLDQRRCISEVIGRTFKPCITGREVSYKMAVEFRATLQLKLSHYRVNYASFSASYVIHKHVREDTDVPALELLSSLPPLY